MSITERIIARAKLASPRDRACTGKKPFSRPTAELIAKRIHREDGANMNAYPCWWCDAWHVGHQIQK